MLQKILFPVLLLGLSACAPATVVVSDTTAETTKTKQAVKKKPAVKNEAEKEFRAPKFLKKPTKKTKSATAADIKKLKADKTMYYTTACLQCRQQRQVDACMKAERCEEIENCTSMNIAKHQRGGPNLPFNERRSEAQMCKEMILDNGMSQ